MFTKTSNATPTTKEEQHIEDKHIKNPQTQKFQLNQISTDFAEGTMDEDNITSYNTLNVIYTGTFKTHSIYFGCKH